MRDRYLEKTRCFVLAFCSGFLILSTVAFCMGGLLGKSQEVLPQPQTTRKVDDVYLPRAQDNLTILLVRREAALDPDWYFLIRMDVERGTFPVVALSPQTTVGEEPGRSTLDECYRKGGIQGVQAALEGFLGIAVDRRLAFTSEGAAQLVDLFGGIRYEFHEDLPSRENKSGVLFSQGRQQLSGRQVCQFLDYPYESEEKRLWMGASLLSTLVDEIVAQAVGEQGDLLFQESINLVDSDISFSDYDSRKEAIRFLSKLSGRRSHGIFVRGTWDGEKMVLYDTTKGQLEKEFRPLEGERESV